MCEACPVIDWAELLPTVRAFTARPVDADMTDYIVWYDRYDPEHKPFVGGKNASLGEMMMAELPVPPGFALTTNAYQRIWADESLVAGVNGLLRSIDHDDLAANRETSKQIRALIEAVPMPADVEADIREAYEALCVHCGHNGEQGAGDLPVAVRSSATAEDLPDASFAGQQDTYLWIKGADDVVHHVQRCWSSLFTDRAIAYRHEMGYLQTAIAMSVGVQKMVDPKASGVAFTLNPSNGDRSQVAIDAAWGLGEAVVGGEVTPDNFLVDKVIHEIIRREISDKHIEYRLNDNGVVEKLDVPDDRRNAPCLTDTDLRAIAVLARRAEKHYGSPQDVEWAVDRHLPEGENVVMLQSRPETVWSQKKGPATSAAQHLKGGAGGAAYGVGSIVGTLLSPLHSKDVHSKGTRNDPPPEQD